MAMKKFFFFALLISSIPGPAQLNNKTSKGQEIKKIVFDDSTVKKLQHFKDSVANALQIIEYKQTQENISRSMEGILQIQKEHRAKQKKDAIVRIAIGLAFLILLVIGLKRKRKK